MHRTLPHLFAAAALAIASTATSTALAKESVAASATSNLSPSEHMAEVPVGGERVTHGGPFSLAEGASPESRDSMIAAADAPRSVGLRQQRQQRQQEPWEVILLGGWTHTPFRGILTATNPFGNTVRKETDLDVDGIAVSVEGRRYFRRLQQQFGARLFLYGTYVEYFGTDKERRDLNFHFGLPNDSGMAIDQKRSIILGVGGRWNIAQRLGFELMVGGHATRTRATALSNEAEGGGPDNRFSSSKTVFGPMVGVGLTYPLWTLATGATVLGMVRWTAMCMRHVDVAGRSPFTGIDYRGRVDGDWKHSVQLGLTLPF